MEQRFEDDLSYGACSFSQKTIHNREPKDTSYSDVLHTRDDLAEPFEDDLKGVFNWTVADYKAMTFADNERYSDIAFAEVFQGYNTFNWTEEEWTDVVAQLDASLLDVYDDRARQLEITTETRRMMNDLLKLSQNDGIRDEAVPAYRLYSAHDSNIANWLAVIIPAYKWNGIPYAATIQFEFWKGATADENGVKMTYNGDDMQLDGCAKSICTVDEFFASMKKHLFPGNLEQACGESPRTFTSRMVEHQTKQIVAKATNIMSDQKFLSIW